MNDDPSLAGLEFMSDNEEQLNFHNVVPNIAERPQLHKLNRPRPPIRDKLRSEISEYLQDKLAKKLNTSRIRIPWSRMKKGDIINWPSKLKFESVTYMNTNEIKMLHQLMIEDKLDFSPEFLKNVQKSLPKNVQKSDRKTIIKDIETALCNKLNSGTNKKFKLVPWHIIEKNDLINWPDGIPFMQPSRLSKNRLKWLHNFREVIFFSGDFLEKLSDPRLDRTYLNGKQSIKR
jgi:hypothetical protein